MPRCSTYLVVGGSLVQSKPLFPQIRHNPMSVGTIYPDFLRVSSRCLDTVLIPERFLGGIAGAFNLPNQIPCSFLGCVTEADSDPPAKTPKKHCI